MAGAKRARVLAACAVGALAMLLGTADAQTRRTAAQAERDRSAETARAAQLRRQAATARTEIAALETRLVESARRRSEAEAAATASEARLAALRAQMETDTEASRRARQALEQAIMNAAFAERRADIGAVRSVIVARALAPQVNAAQRQRTQAVADARVLETAVLQEQRILIDAQAAIDSERAEIVTLAARRRAVQVSLNRDANAAERRARTLAAEARSLRDLAQRVAAASNRRSSAGTAVGVIPAGWMAPADGRITEAFGARAGGAPAAQGARIRTRSSAQVVSPAAGEVAYAGLFRSYGQVLILNLDGGYALVLTGLESIRVGVGESVRAGQPVGEMPNSDMTAPDLYVEVRREGRPIDPGRWLAARGLVAERGVRAG